MVLTELFGNETDLVTVPAGQPLFRAGDPPGGVMIDPAKRSASAVVRSESRFVAIDMKRFHRLAQQTPEFATHVMKVVVNRLRAKDAKLLEMQAKLKQR